MSGGARCAETLAQARTPECPGVARREEGGGGAGRLCKSPGRGGGGMRRREVLRWGRLQGVGGGGGRPEVRRAGRLAGGVRGRARRLLSGGSGGAPRRGR